MGRNIESFVPEPAQLIAFGTVNAIPKRNENKIIFTTAPSQYMLPLKDIANTPRQPFPIRCKLDLTSPRYKKVDGNPWAPDIKLHGRILFYGSISRVVRKLSDSSGPKQINYVKISINDIVYSANNNQSAAVKIEPGFIFLFLTF